MNVQHNMIDMSYVTIGFTGTRSEFDMQVELWAVRGIPRMLFPTKMAAEVAARRTFPNDEMAANYGRLSFVKFIQEA